MRKKFKFKKLLNEYRSLLSEFKYVEEVFVEANKEFEIYLGEYCNKNGIGLPELNKKHSKKVKEIFSDSSALSLSIKKKQRQEEFDSKDLFRQIARKFHPDALETDNPNKDEYEEVFKRASAAIDNAEWGKLFDIADNYNLNLKKYDDINKCLKIALTRIKQNIRVKKDSYAYVLYECEDNANCKENVIKRFLKHLFNV